MKKFLAAILMICLLLSCMTACETSTSKEPATPEECLAEMQEQMSNVVYKETWVDKRTILKTELPAEAIERLSKNDTVETIYDGHNFLMSYEESGIVIEQTFVDGTYYTHMFHEDGLIEETKEKITISLEDLAALGEAAKEFESLAETYKLTTYTQETDKNGNIVIIAEGLSDEGKALLTQSVSDATMGAMNAEILNFTVKVVLEKDTYRCLEQTSTNKYQMMILGRLTVVEAINHYAYSYEDGLAVVAPADADR